jgi:hypothetical protein
LVLFGDRATSTCNKYLILPHPIRYKLASKPSALAVTSRSRVFGHTWGKNSLLAFLPRILVRSPCRLAEHPNVRAIFRQDRPRLRSAAILTRSRTAFGLPSRLPFARALRSPARTRSQINRSRKKLALRVAPRLQVEQAPPENVTLREKGAPGSRRPIC